VLELQSREERSPEGRVRTLSELSAMPVISSVDRDDLRYQDGTHRVWLSRRALDEGAECLNQVREEALDHGKWVTTGTYAACTEREDCSCPDCDTF